MLLSVSNVELHNGTVIHDGTDALRDDWFFGDIIRHLKTMPPPPVPEPEPVPVMPFMSPRDFVLNKYRSGDVITQTHVVKWYSALHKKVSHKVFVEVFQSLGFRETSPRHWLFV